MSIDVQFIALKLLKIVVVWTFVMLVLAYMIYAERRVLAVIQDRLGPNRVGPFGLLQPFADVLKFIFKEDIIPLAVNKWLYLVAPVVTLVPAMMVLIVYPFGPTVNIPFIGPVNLYVTNFNVGLLYVLALTSLGIYGIVLAGWSSNSKYSLLGGLRSSAQMISYELSLSLSLIGVVLQAGSLDLVKIVLLLPAAGLPDLPRERDCRDESRAIRPARGRDRAGGRLPHRVQLHEVRHVLHG
jgi:NADH-quinone oxidoreductase subunit H